jgi:hypothetical protein
MKKIFYLLFIFPLFCGCSSKYAYLNDDPLTGTVSINGKVKDLMILDLRKDVTDRKLKIPFIGFPGKTDEIRPFLNVEQIGLIRNEFGSYFKGSSANYKLIIRVTEGLQRYSASFFSEKEYVKFSMEIDLLVAENDVKVYTAFGESFYEVKSLDASNEYIEKLYRKAIKTCVYEICKRIKTPEAGEMI